MIFWICLGGTLGVALLFCIMGAREQDFGLGTIMASVIIMVGGAVSFFVILIAVAVTTESDKTHVEVVAKDFEVAEGSKISVDSGWLSFVYVEDGVPEKFSEQVTPVAWEGSGETIEITTRYVNHGTKVVPWGITYEERSAVVK